MNGFRFRAGMAMVVFLTTGGGADGNELAPINSTLHADLPNFEPEIFETYIGTVTSQGDAATIAASARTKFGVDGSGVKLGIISDSFDALGGALNGISSGDLPGAGNPNGFTTPIQVVKDDLSPFRVDEGRAMAEIVHDLAPGASLLFHSAFNSPTPSVNHTIANAINGLVSAGADIIVDDVRLRTDPNFQDGLTAQTANLAAADGVHYFTAVGNDGSEGYAAPYNEFVTSEGFRFHDFDPGSSTDIALDIVIPPGGSVAVGVQWSDPYPSLGASSNATDFNAGLIDITGQFVAVSTNEQAEGDDPWEITAPTLVNNSAFPALVGLVIEHISGPSARDLKAIVFNQGIIDDPDVDLDSPTAYGQGLANAVVGVAAHQFDLPDDVEEFSSLGPGTILFDGVGNPLFTPQIRDAAIVTGPDGVNTTFFSSDSLIDPDSDPNFFGTSAAAPHAAAVAALILEMADRTNLTLTFADLRQILMDTAVDIEAAGFDNVSGAGRIDAFAALQSIWLVADFDLDGDVDAFDLGLWQIGFGTTIGAVIANGDADFDDDVDAFDLGLWQINFGQSNLNPEPTTLTMFLALGACVRRPRRTRS